jgi:ornithine carbamoyltransferase
LPRHFLAISDFTRQELETMLELAVGLKDERRSTGNSPILAGKVLAMVFQKPSLRTRVSFDMAMRHLGGDACISRRWIGL